MIFELIFNLLDVSFLLGMTKSSALPRKLDENEENELINQLFDEKTHTYARNELITHNLRLVAHIAQKYDSKDEDLDDLISIGTIGLVKAVDTYSYSKSVKLATYAAKCIENEILMILRSNKKYSKNTSLFESIGIDKDGSEISLIDILPSSEPSVQDTYDKKLKINALKKYLEILDDREMRIISLRYGLDGEIEHTQKEISKKYNISRSYVSRIEKRALTKLLSEFKKNKY